MGKVIQLLALAVLLYVVFSSWNEMTMELKIVSVIGTALLVYAVLASP